MSGHGGGGGKEEVGFAPVVGTFFIRLLEAFTLLPGFDEIIKEVTSSSSGGGHHH